MSIHVQEKKEIMEQNIDRMPPGRLAELARDGWPHNGKNAGH